MNKDKKLRTVIYCRVSSNKEDQLNSLDVQESLYSYYVQNSSILSLIDIIKETKSGLDTNRDGIKKIMEMAEKNEIDLVLIKSISRLSRNAEEAIRLCKKFLELNVDIYFELENIRLSDMCKHTNDDFSIEEVIRTYAFTAQDYSQTLSKHIRWGVKRSFESEGSGYVNRICYGYKKINGEIVVDNKQAGVVREIFSLAAKGSSFGQIIRILEEKKIPSPSGRPTWSKPVLKHILTNEKYIGNTVLGKTKTTDYLFGTRKANNGEDNLYVHEHTHPQIISKEMFEQVQNRLHG